MAKWDIPYDQMLPNYAQYVKLCQNGIVSFGQMEYSILIQKSMPFDQNWVSSGFSDFLPS